MGMKMKSSSLSSSVEGWLAEGALGRRVEVLGSRMESLKEKAGVG